MGMVDRIELDMEWVACIEGKLVAMVVVDALGIDFENKY